MTGYDADDTYRFFTTRSEWEMAQRGIQSTAKNLFFKDGCHPEIVR